MVNRLVREERCEFRHNRAVECRAYMERVSITIILGAEKIMGRRGSKREGSNAV